MRTTEPDGPGSGISTQVPPARLGARLRAVRRSRHRSIRAAARASGLEPTILRAAERGTHVLSEPELRSLLATYRVTLSELLPERGRPITVADGTLSVAGQVRTLATDDPSPDEVLETYLDLIYQLRGRTAGDALTLRDEDLDALADALGREPAIVEARLVQLMDCSREEAADLRRAILRRRVLVPAAGLMMGATVLTVSGFDAVGPRASVAGADPAATTVSAPAPAPTAVTPGIPVEIGDPATVQGVDIGTAVEVERHPDGTVETTVRTDAPPPLT